MAGRSSVAMNTAKARKIACKEANLMRTIGCSVERLNGENKLPFYVENNILNAKKRSQQFRDERAIAFVASVLGGI